MWWKKPLQWFGMGFFGGLGWLIISLAWMKIIN